MKRRTFLTAAAVGAGALATFAAPKQTFIAGVVPAGRGRAQSADPLTNFWRNSEDAGELGFHHIEFNDSRTRIVESYADRVSEFKDQAERLGLKLAGIALFSHIASSPERSEMIERHMLLGRFMAAVGGSYITHMLAAGTALNESAIEEEYSRVDLKLWAVNANEIGKRLKNEFGVTLGYHPELLEVRSGLWERVLEATDDRYVGFLPDTGHLAAGGADAVAICRKHHSRIVCVHLKDFRPGTEPVKAGNVSFGQGSVNLTGVIDMLGDARFAGYVLGESGGTNQQMHSFMTETLKLTL